MIDEANLAISELEDRVRRANDRRYAFYRMLHATDRVLWKLEEMNRDGIKAIPLELREVIRDELVELPAVVSCVFRDTDAVQEMLDSVFEVQERLFRWKDPAHEADEDEEERLVG
jgi:hypothetical protein